MRPSASPRHLGSRRVRLAAALTGAALVPALALTALPSASAAPSLSSSASAADDVVVITVRAADGDVVGLATRLDAAGYQVAGRSGDALWVQGDAATLAALGAESGLVIVSSEVVRPEVPAAGVDASQDPILPKRLDGKTYETFYGGYRTVDAYYEFEDDLAEAYPELVQVVEYGEAWGGDNALRAVCITADAQDGCELMPDVDKSRFLLFAQIHAREITTSEVTWRFVTSLIDGYKKRAQARAILDSTEVWIIPQINPDGIITVQDGVEEQGTGYDSPAYQRKNMNDTEAPVGGCSGTWAFSHAGIDLNRNFASHYGGASTSSDPCSEVYKGIGPESEPEAIALDDLFADLFRDQRGTDPTDPAPLTATGAALSLHTYANLVVFPWEYNAAVKAPNDAGLRSMGFRLSHFNGYETGQTGEILYNASGTTNDQIYDRLGIATFTFEMGPGGGSCGGFLPLYTCQDAFYELNEPALYYAATAARQPYKLGQGPTTSGVKAKVKGKKTKITATSDDDAYGTSGVGRPAAQNVTAMRVYADAAPWDGGTATTMSIKGSGTSVKGSVKVKAGKKKHVAYVQGRDADGNWGPVAAVWIGTKK